MTGTEDDLDIPVDPKPSKIRSGGPVSTFDPDAPDPDDIATVDAKIEAFREQHPAGAIASHVEKVLDADGLIVAFEGHASVWFDRANSEGMPDSTGNSFRDNLPDDYPPYETSESVAVGRALRFLGVTNA